MGEKAARRRRGSDPPDLESCLEQGISLLKAQLAQVWQTASNVQGDLGSILHAVRKRVAFLEVSASRQE
ncbi:hypothetical protein PF003_g16357 [Phytophthora fragariae]|nr:hypothetical protein PF003_g16357 [Phytophthora fragariae]